MNKFKLFYSLWGLQSFAKPLRYTTWRKEPVEGVPRFIPLQEPLVGVSVRVSVSEAEIEPVKEHPSVSLILKFDNYTFPSGRHVFQ